MSDDTHPPEYGHADRPQPPRPLDEFLQRESRFDPEHQLRLLEHRHAMALLFIDVKGLRIEYDTHMARLGLASEFVTGTFRREEAR